MPSKPKNFSQAIDELEDETPHTNGNGDFRARIQSELNNLEETLAKLRPHIEDLSSKVGSEAKKAKEKVDEQVKENPWAAIGIAGLIFFILGFLFASRRND